MTKATRLGWLCATALVMSLAAPVGASAAPPEFGQCLKKPAAGGAGYADKDCTKAIEGTKAKYQWVAGAVAGENGFETSMLSLGAWVRNHGHLYAWLNCTGGARIGPIRPGRRQQTTHHNAGPHQMQQ